MNKNEQYYVPFTVLMSVYKGDKAIFLQKTVNSILSQTVPPTEIVFVEDGPVPADIQQVILEFQSSFKGKFVLIKLSKNAGLGHALNIGSKYVTTNWIARVDSDDINVSNRFQMQLNAIKKNPDVSLVGGQVDEFQEYLNQTVGSRIVPTTHGEIVRFLKYRNPFNHPTVMINKLALDCVGNYLSFGNLEDYYLWSRLIAHGYKTVNLPYVLVHMRIGNGMYARRGKFSNIQYIFRLHNYLFQNHLCNIFQLVTGISIGVVNLMLPKKLRKHVYQNFFHKLRSEKDMGDN